MTAKPEFVVSLDFELLWGVRDHLDRRSYGQNILGARQAIPRILEIFQRFDIRATWATVGLLFCRTRDELMASLPPSELRPRYANTGLSNYIYLRELGQNEEQDPYYFGGSIVDQIAQCPGQEIATHTFSHFYALEEGSTVEAFSADLEAAKKTAEMRNLVLRSIVFPRNQYSDAHVEVCRSRGITAWRGNPKNWAYQPNSVKAQTLPRRGLRLLDAFSGVLGSHTYAPETGPFRNVPASLFLRPCTGILSKFHAVHIATIKRGLSQAAKMGKGYHLWWHPHNFGLNLEENMAALTDVVSHYDQLRNEHGMVSRNMCGVA